MTNAKVKPNTFIAEIRFKSSSVVDFGVPVKTMYLQEQTKRTCLTCVFIETKCKKLNMPRTTSPGKTG